MFEKKVQIEPPKTYPFEQLYRPWSWALSSFANVSLLLFLLLLCYAVFRRSNSARRKIGKVSYRRVIIPLEGKSNAGKVKVLVTGGCGCLGRRLITTLVEDGGYEVHSLDLFIPVEEDRSRGVASFISVDVADQQALEIALNQVNFEAVFHCAGLLPKVGVKTADFYHVNTTGTQILLEICSNRSISRFVYTSSCDVLLSSKKQEVLNNVDETWPVPETSLNAYCGSKKEAEELVLKKNGHNGMVTCSLRCAIIADSKSLMFRELLLNRGAFIGKGMNMHSLVDVDICARAHILAEKKLRDGIESSVAGQVYHLAGDSYSVREMMEYSPDSSDITIWGHPTPISIPKWLSIILAIFNMSSYSVTGYTPFSSLDLNAVEFLSHSYTFNSNKAKQQLGVEFHLSWKEVVQKIVDEYEEEIEAKKM